MKHLTLALTLLIPSSSCLMAQTRHVTLTLNSFPPRPIEQTNSFTLGPNETAELVTFKPANGQSGIGALSFEKDGAVFDFNWWDYDSTKPIDFYKSGSFCVSGPAVVSFRPVNNYTKCWATFKITPDAFPPDKTFIIPDGTPGATVTLECSTNLLTWTTATNGFYTGTNGAKFFRINAQRAQ